MKDHIQHLAQVFKILRDNGLKLKRKKCHLVRAKTEYLGFIVSGFTLEPMPSKVEAIREAPVPVNKTQLRSFLGLASYYRRFVPGFASLAQPLNKLLRKEVEWEWGSDQQEAYDAIVGRLTSKPVLALPNWELSFTLTTDASALGIAAVLSQVQEDGEHPICYASRSVSKTERNYAPTHLEGLAVIWAVKYFRHYLLGRHFKLKTDHSALISIFTSKTPLIGKLARWSMILSEFDFDIQHLRGKNNPADFPSRNLPPPDDDEPDHDEHDILAIDVAIGGMDYAHYLALKYYLEKQDYPKGATEADRRKLRNRASGYFVQEGQLYLRRKRAPLGYLQVLHERIALEKVRIIHEEFHDGVDNCLRRVLQKYCGPKLRSVVQTVVRICHLCQTHNPDTAAARAEPLHPIEATRPLAIVGLDVVGPIAPQSPEGYRYILTAIDYFTRWPLAMPAKEANTETMINFILNHVIAVFGVPETVITDRGSIFTDHTMEQLFKQLGIKHSATTAYRPQSNGRVERMHRTLKTTLAKLTEGDRERWPSKLWKALLAIRTMVNESTKTTPARLLFGFELATPTVWQPAPDRDLDEPIEDTVTQRIKKMDVDVETLRRQAAENSINAQARMAMRYNQYVVPRSFKEGDLVLLRIEQPTSISQSAKFSQLYEGPYRIVRPLVNGTYLITDGQGAQDKVHVDRLKAYTAHTEMVPEVVSAAKPLRSALRRYRLN